MRPRFVVTALVCTTLLTSNLALAQFSQQGPKLVASDAVGSAEEGFSVSLSADGNTAIVAGPGDDSATGAVWIWTRTGILWTQSAKLVGAGAVGKAHQGFSASISADGNTAIVGGREDNNGAGGAWVWIRAGNVWTQQTKLVGTGAVGEAQQGNSVCLSADGNTVIVGGWTDDGQNGAAWVWTRSGNVWTQQGNKLVGSGAVGTALQGTSVALSADGNTAIVGGQDDNGFQGAAWVWIRSGGVWTQQGLKLVGSSDAFPPGKGNSVSLSADGNTAIVAGFNDHGGIGAVWVWIRNGGTWTQQGNKLVGSGSSGTPEQGFSASLSADGNTAVSSGLTDHGSAGAVWIWTRSGGVWTQQGSKLVGSGETGRANLGTSVSLSADGKTVIAGGSGDNSNAGAAWVFVATDADLGITKSVSGGPLSPAGGNLSYTITVINNGPGTASNVVVTDTLPAGTTFISATPSQGSCSGTTNVSCALGGLAIGGSATINLVLKTASTPATVSNTATVTASEVDLNPANNSSTATITTVDPASVPAVSLLTLIALAGVLAVFGALRMSG